MVNGVNGSDKERVGYMSRERAANTLDLAKAGMARPFSVDEVPDYIPMQKSVSLSTGLTYYDLRAPALNMYPTVTPIRNSLTRVARPNPGDKFNYKLVTGTTGSGIATMGWVPEGQRAASMSYGTTSASAFYATFGEEDSVTEEALNAASGFEDEAALVQLRTMLRLMVKEEMGLLAGNQSLALGTAPTPVVTTIATTGTILTGTYSVIVVGLTMEGYQNASVANGVVQSLSITGNDKLTYTLNGGSSNKSTGSLVTTSGSTSAAFATTTAVSGTVAYAWYAGAAGAERLQTITTINSVVFTAPFSTTTQLATAITADCSTNSNYAFNGLWTTALSANSGAYVAIQPTGTVGTGTVLSASSNGGITQFDTMLTSMWDSNFLSPTVIYANATGIKAVSNLVLTTSTSPIMRYFNTTDQAAPEFRVTTAGVTAWYFNPYTVDGGMKIALRAHPFVASGNFFAWTEVLPPWFTTNALPAPAIVTARADYYTEVWPKTTRAQYFGVYSQEALPIFAPFAMGSICNVAGA
jgi:hypothetical protein